MKIGDWKISKSRELATREREDNREGYEDFVTVSLSADGRSIRVLDHRTYYPSSQQEIPLAVIEALRPGGVHPGYGWDERTD